MLLNYPLENLDGRLRHVFQLGMKYILVYSISLHKVYFLQANENLINFHKKLYVKASFYVTFQQGDDTYLARQNSGDESHGVSLHVLECFKRNITGKGIRITVLDDGLEHSHQDIKENYVSLLYGL